MKIVQRLVTMSTALVLSFGLAVAAAGPASAGTCQWTPFGYWCGDAANASGFELRVTTTLGSGPHYCDVWNWGGGSTPKWQHAKCTQIVLSPGRTMDDVGVDVDAVTFPYDNYLLNFHGSWSWKTRGVWTKIYDNESAYCYTHLSLGVPVCSITWDPTSP